MVDVEILNDSVENIIEEHDALEDGQSHPRWNEISNLSMNIRVTKAGSIRDQM